VEAGARFLRVIRFPQPWTLPAAPGLSAVGQLPAAYEVRRARNGRALFFRLRSPDGRQSEQIYHLLETLDHPSPATEEQWSQAQPASATALVLPDKPPFQGLGAFSGNLLWAPSKQYAAVSTFDSSSKPSPGLRYLSGGEPSEGTVYLDIYDTISGRKLTAGHGSYHGFGPKILFEQARWFGEDVFIMPLDYLAGTCFIANMANP